MAIIGDGPIPPQAVGGGSRQPATFGGGQSGPLALCGCELLVHPPGNKPAREEDDMASTDQHLDYPGAKPAGQSPSPAETRAATAAGAPGAVAWGNSAPLALAGFATTTFMLSMINTGLVPAGTLPVVFGVAFAFGGLAQLIAGIIQLRTGNTFGGMLFTGYGAFWLSLWAIAEFFLKGVPPLQLGHALGLFLYAFGIFTVVMFAASLRTSVIVVTTLFLLGATFFVLGAGNYGASSGLIKT